MKQIFYISNKEMHANLLEYKSFSMSATISTVALQQVISYTLWNASRKKLLGLEYYIILPDTIS